MTFEERQQVRRAVDAERRRRLAGMKLATPPKSFTPPKPRASRKSHGISGYNKRGCKCDVCRAAKARQNAKR